MTRQIVYESAKWDKDHTKLIEKETRWDDGSREVELHATTSEGYEGYGNKDELSLFINEDPVEEIAEYGVSWRDLAGYFSVSIRTANEKDAIRLFKALQKVTGYDVT